MKRNSPLAIQAAAKPRLGRHLSRWKNKEKATIKSMLVDLAIVYKLTVTYSRPQFDKPEMHRYSKQIQLELSDKFSEQCRRKLQTTSSKKSNVLKFGTYKHPLVSIKNGFIQRIFQNENKKNQYENKQKTYQCQKKHRSQLGPANEAALLNRPCSVYHVGIP